MEALAGLAAIFGLGLFTFLAINSIVGLICLFLFNLVAGMFNMRLNTGCLNSVIVGLFGLPGLAFLVILGIITGSVFKDNQNNQ